MSSQNFRDSWNAEHKTVKYLSQSLPTYLEMRLFYFMADIDLYS